MVEKRKPIKDRRKIIRRKEDRLLFQKEFNNIAESLAGLKDCVAQLQDSEYNNKEVVKAFEKLIEILEQQIISLDKKLFTIHTYWISKSD